MKDSHIFVKLPSQKFCSSYTVAITQTTMTEITLRYKLQTGDRNDIPGPALN